ncbi:MAG: hypothetical protein NVS3B20_25550 [Polyangiales bacterium]
MRSSHLYGVGQFGATLLSPAHRWLVDPYTVLGVEVSATEREIVRAFRRLALLHHPDRNGGSLAAATRFREIKGAYEALRSRARANPFQPPPEKPATPKPTTSRYVHFRVLDANHVDRVHARLGRLIATIRAGMAAPSRKTLAAIIDDARWTRLDVDNSLALKGHVADLRDAHWSGLLFTSPLQALEVLEAFVRAPTEGLDLVEMRNLRARLDGVLSVARGYGAALASSGHK